MRQLYTQKLILSTILGKMINIITKDYAMKIYELLLEARISDIEYHDDAEQVIAVLKSRNSQVYTNLAKKVEKISQLEAEISSLKEQVKQETRDNIQDLFDAEDAVKTRVVDTVSFILTLSKDPKPTESPKYKDILEALSKQLTPDLINVLEALKKQMVTVTQKAPSLRIRPQQIDEGFLGDLFKRIKQSIFSWARGYDAKLDQLKLMAAV